MITKDSQLDKDYWNNRYKNNTSSWDLGTISPPIQSYIDTIANKSIRILIPGCGNSYEAEYLLDQGFTNITIIDIAPILVESLQQKFITHKNIRVILGDFFEHQGSYDLIIEQTFFCTLPPTFREKYVCKMHQLLADGCKLVGLLFNKIFDQNPPFGGNKEEYINLFESRFYINKMETCTNSIAPRKGTELWVEFEKKML